MADYHPLIARAVAGLEKNTGENRRSLYERARVALVAQLRGVVPALDESEITRERLALEEAIRKVEAEAARHAREMARPTIMKRAETPRREEPPRPPRPPMTLSSPRTQSSLEVAPAEDAPPPPPQRLARFTQRTLQDEGLKEFRDVSNSPNVAGEMRHPEQADHDAPSESYPSQAPPPEPHPLEEYGQLEPQVQPDNLWALPLDGRQGEAPVDLDAQHPPVQRHVGRDEAYEQPPPRRPPPSYGKMIRTGLVLGLILALGVLVYWQRSTIASVASGVASLFQSSTTPPREAATPARPKITDRIGQPSQQPSPGPQVAQRVVLYEEEPDDPQGKRFIGTVLWRTEMRPATPGRPPELAVRGDIEVPERNMSVTLSLRRNTDQSLPASHTIEIVFTLPADSSSGGVQKVPGVLMKQAEQTRGVPLAGLAVPV
ncbi:MAG: hypothetical protein QOF09_3897, partial [Alphaproteobacteria bacterium]|nr:hypothetical protein [Alphaproteobacteria bacterium]